MKYSKALIIAAAALSVFAVASAADTVPTPTPAPVSVDCSKDAKKPNQVYDECRLCPIDHIPTSDGKCELISDKLAQQAKSITQKPPTDCVPNAARVDGTSPCKCSDGFVPSLETRACIAKQKKEDCEKNKLNEEFKSDTCVCKDGDRRHPTSSVCEKNDEDTCHKVLNRVWDATAKKCTDACSIGERFKDGEKFTSEKCFVPRAIADADCKTADNHRVYTATGFCVCEPGFNTDDVHKSDTTKCNGASLFFVSSSVVLAFVGSMIYLL